MIIEVTATLFYTDGSLEAEYQEQMGYMTFYLNPIKASCINEEGNVCSTSLTQYVWELVDPFRLYDDVTVTWKFVGTLTPAGPF